MARTWRRSEGCRDKGWEVSGVSRWYGSTQATSILRSVSLSLAWNSEGIHSFAAGESTLL